MERDDGEKIANKMEDENEFEIEEEEIDNSGKLVIMEQESLEEKQMEDDNNNDAAEHDNVDEEIREEFDNGLKLTGESIPDPTETMSEPNDNDTQDNDHEKEEGELEEGELEEDEDDEEIVENKEEKVEEIEIKEVIDKKEDKKTNNDKEKKDKSASKDEQEFKKDEKEGRTKEGRKRKHAKDDDKRKKRKKFYNDDELGKKAEKATDFDCLLQQQMSYINGPSPSQPTLNSDEEEGDPNSYNGRRHLRDGEQVNSGSDEDWEARRRKRKRRRSRSRSPCRKNEAICMFFLQGNCQRGSSCPYSHEAAPTRKMELCKFYMMDCCAKKEKCLYMHKDFPCKFYHFGMKCKAGDLCKFSHNPLQEPTRNILLKHIESAPKDILGDFPRLSKHVAIAVLTVTEAKRNGNPIDEAEVTTALDVVGKGFRYIDKVVKSLKKTKSPSKRDEKEEKDTKSEQVRSDDKPKKRSKSNEKDEKDKPRDRERDKDRARDNRHRDRDRDRDRKRERNRERSRHGSDGSRFSSSKDHSSKYRESSSSSHKTRVDESKMVGSPSKEGPPGATDGRTTPQDKWYSSDEENSNNNIRIHSPSIQSISEKDPESASNKDFKMDKFPLGSSGLPNLENIGVDYLKNLLNKVHSSSGANNSTSEVPPRDSRSEDWNPSIEQDNQRDTTFSDDLDLANDIKDVFYEAPAPSTSSSMRNISQDLQSLIQRARENSSSNKNYETFDNSRDQSRNMRGANSWGRTDSYGSPRRDSDGPSQRMLRDPRLSRDSDLDGGKEELRKEQSFKEPLNRKDSDPSARAGKSKDADFRVIPSTRRNSQNNDNKDISSDTDLRASNSIYDVDLRKLGSPDTNTDNSSNFPFVPIPTPAKEIDGSINSNPPVYYKLVLITIPKPNFSNLKINKEDSRMKEDPRVRLMLRKSSTEEENSGSPKIPRKEGEFPFGSPPNDQQILGSRSQELIDTKDPRKLPSRDPRMDSKSMRIDPRVDPRLSGRFDPRSTGPRNDPRMQDGRDFAGDQDADQRIPAMGLPFQNGVMDSPFGGFPPMGAMQGPVVPQGIDPRGRPGLLGPGPGPPGMPDMNIPLSGPMAQPFLMGPGAGGAFGPPDGDLMTGGTFQPNQNWNAPRMPFNDPRLNRDMDMNPSYSHPPVS